MNWKFYSRISCDTWNWNWNWRTFGEPAKSGFSRIARYLLMKKSSLHSFTHSLTLSLTHSLSHSFCILCLQRRKGTLAVRTLCCLFSAENCTTNPCSVRALLHADFWMEKRATCSMFIKVGLCLCRVTRNNRPSHTHIKTHTHTYTHTGAL